MGYFTTERVNINSDGVLSSTGPNTYIIPTMADIPSEFYVHLLPGVQNPSGIYSSKVRIPCVRRTVQMSDSKRIRVEAVVSAHRREPKKRSVLQEMAAYGNVSSKAATISVRAYGRLKKAGYINKKGTTEKKIWMCIYMKCKMIVTNSVG